MILTIIITAMAVFSLEEYYHQTMKPVKMEKVPMYWQEWIDFIIANINSAKTEDQCLMLKSLILLFERFFRKKVNKSDFDRTLSALWNRLDTRHKALRAQWDDIPHLKGDMRVDSTGNII